MVGRYAYIWWFVIWPCSCSILYPILSTILYNNHINNDLSFYNTDELWFRCLEKEYLSLKCFLLERFLHDVLFESSSSHLLRGFLNLHWFALIYDMREYWNVQYLPLLIDINHSVVLYFSFIVVLVYSSVYFIIQRSDCILILLCSNKLRTRAWAKT